MRIPLGLLAALLAATTALVVSPSPALAATCSTIEVTGHRGYVYPNPATTSEDTLAAFAGAVAQGATGVEMDLWHLGTGGQATAMQATAINHDSTWDRTIDPATMAAADVLPGTAVAATSYDQRLLLRTKGGQPVTGLGGVFGWAAAHPSVEVYVEVKAAFTSAEIYAFQNDAAHRAGGIPNVVFYGGNWTWVQPFGIAQPPTNGGAAAPPFAIGVKYKSTWTAAQYAGIAMVAGDLGTISAPSMRSIRYADPGVAFSTTAISSTAEFDQALTEGYDQLLADYPATAVSWIGAGCP